MKYPVLKKYKKLTIATGFILFMEFLLFFQQATPQNIKSQVIIDPLNKQNIRGTIKIAYAWGEQLPSPYSLSRGLVNLKEAMNKWTNIQTSMERHLMLSSEKIMKMPFVFVTCRNSFELTETEKKNVNKYFRNGGFMVLDDAEPLVDKSRSGASLRKMVRDAIPNAKFLPIPDNHPLYHCFFDFNDGAPLGAERGFIINSDGTVFRSKQIFKLEGVWYKGRLAAIYSDKGYIIRWNDNYDNEPQLKMGVNMIIYALTQNRSIAEQY